MWVLCLGPENESKSKRKTTFELVLEWDLARSVNWSITLVEFIGTFWPHSVVRVISDFLGRTLTPVDALFCLFGRLIASSLVIKPFAVLICPTANIPSGPASQCFTLHPWPSPPCLWQVSPSFSWPSVTLSSLSLSTYCLFHPKKMFNSFCLVPWRALSVLNMRESTLTSLFSPSVCESSLFFCDNGLSDSVQFGPRSMPSVRSIFSLSILSPLDHQSSLDNLSVLLCLCTQWPFPLQQVLV